MDLQFLALGEELLNNLPAAWTLILLLLRFAGMMMVLPAIGAGLRGLAVRGAAILVLALASATTSAQATLPGHPIELVLQGFSELILGAIVGIIPLMIISGAQVGAQLASTSMGLGASQLIDPTSGTTVSDIARIYGDIVAILFLIMGGHHVVVYAVSGLGGEIIPGTFILGGNTIDMLVAQSGHIFRVGVMISSPVIVALLLTQFVMGLISRAVPTVNIFVVSFPLTIGIGFILSMLALPEVIAFMLREIPGIEGSVLKVLGEVKRHSP